MGYIKGLYVRHTYLYCIDLVRVWDRVRVRVWVGVRITVRIQIRIRPRDEGCTVLISGQS